MDIPKYFGDDIIMFFDPQNMGINSLFMQFICDIGWDIANNIFFGNGGTNLHKKGTWDIRTTC